MDSERQSGDEQQEPSGITSDINEAGDDLRPDGAMNRTDVVGLDNKTLVRDGKDEEFASEVAVTDPPAAYGGAERDKAAGTATQSDTRDEPDKTEQGGVAVGWFSLALAIASLFVWPALLGPAAVLFGFISWMQGSRALGIWSIVLGIISFIAYLALVPLYR